MPNVYIKATSNRHYLRKEKVVTLLKIEFGRFFPTN